MGGLRRFIALIILCWCGGFCALAASASPGKTGSAAVHWRDGWPFYGANIGEPVNWSRPGEIESPSVPVDHLLGRVVGVHRFRMVPGVPGGWFLTGYTLKVIWDYRWGLRAGSLFTFYGTLRGDAPSLLGFFMPRMCIGQTVLVSCTRERHEEAYKGHPECWGARLAVGVSTPIAVPESQQAPLFSALHAMSRYAPPDRYITNGLIPHAAAVKMLKSHNYYKWALGCYLLYMEWTPKDIDLLRALRHRLVRGNSVQWVPRLSWLAYCDDRWAKEPTEGLTHVFSPDFHFALGIHSGTEGGLLSAGWTGSDLLRSLRPAGYHPHPRNGALARSQQGESGGNQRSAGSPAVWPTWLSVFGTAVAVAAGVIIGGAATWAMGRRPRQAV